MWLTGNSANSYPSIKEVGLRGKSCLSNWQAMQAGYQEGGWKAESKRWYHST